MKKSSRKEHQRQLDVIAAIPDDAIDTSDVPELTEEHFRRGVRGMFYRPIKKPVTMRLDADVIEMAKAGWTWLSDQSQCAFAPGNDAFQSPE